MRSNPGIIPLIASVLAFSVHRRWIVVLAAVMLCGLGIAAMTRLPIDAVPDITNNQVQINTYASALSPVDVEKQITYPIEAALAGIPGLEYTRSLSRNAFSQVTAVFTDRTDIYFARNQINERLSEIRDSLPGGATLRLGPVATGLGEIYMWAVRYAPPGDKIVDGKPGWQSSGAYLTPEGQLLETELARDAYLRTVQDWIIKPQLRTVPGVAGIDVSGGFQKQYHVQPDPAKLMALDLGFDDVIAALAANNLNRGAGTIEQNGEGYVVRSTGRLTNMADIAEVVVATRGGVPVRIKDLADVAIGRELRTGAASVNGEEAVVGTALMRIGENSRTVAAAVGARLAEIRATLPPDIEVETVLDRTLLVDATIKTVGTNLVEGALLVILVLFVLLGNFRAALITALVIPVTMLLTMSGMVAGRISANLMSLGALDFGLIVDGAVIIAENSLRHLAEQQRAKGRTLFERERLATIIASAEEMIRPTVYGQAIIILVYVPLLTFSGTEGKMFEPMAMTVIIALACAFVLSLTFVPALLALLITGPVKENENIFVRSLQAIYAPSLEAALKYPSAIFSVAIALVVATGVLFLQLGQEFIPQLDEKNLAIQATRIPSTGINQSQAMEHDVEKVISRFPQVAVVFSKTGTAEIANDPMPVNVTDIIIMLKPQAQWPDPHLGKAGLLREIEAAIDLVPGNMYEFSQPIQNRFNELLAGVRGDIAIKIFGEEFGPMREAAEKIAEILRSTPGAEDVKVEQTTGLPTLDIAIDKAAAARHGLSVQAVQDVIGTAIGGEDAGFVYEGDRRFPIIVRLADAPRANIDTLRHLPVPLPPSTVTGRTPAILLEQIANFETSEGANQISRENGKRRVVVTANARGRDIASIVAEARDKIAKQVALPSGYWITWGGQFENLASARDRLLLVVPGCFVLIFLLLYSALGTARDALLVFSAVPLALTGGVAALWLRDMSFSVSAAVGFIALSGVAVLNGLVMLTSIKDLLARGAPRRAAIVQGARTRLRPVAMTALVASLGFIPMAIATGTGAEVQRPIATVVIGGLTSATLLTLLVLPALYLRFAKPGKKPAAAEQERLARGAAAE
jgi:cobalt-zinc-cadmium resistance protein CzcA